MLDRPILVPLDGSELSEKAIPYAASIARATHQPLVLLTIWEGVERELHSAPSSTVRDFDLRGRALCRAYLEDVAQRVAAQGVRVATEMRDGHPSEELLWVCDEHAPGLVVMATHGRSGVQRMWYGSVASKLMQMAPVPTLLVGPKVLEDQKGPPAIRKVLVPLGGSALSESALEPAVTLAEAFEARLILASAIRLPAQAFAFDVSEAYLPEIDQEVTAAAEEYLGRVCQEVKTARPVETRVLRGLPAEAILQLVAQEHIDLVVMASHARSGVIRWAFGSVADRVIRGAAPVLLIRPEVAPTPLRSEEVYRRHCHNCGRAIAYMAVRQDDRCLRCRQHLHVCANCVYFDALACLLQRSEAHDTYPGLSCQRFQFRETVAAKGRAATAGRKS
jgi:nucleotide-binding universal stress UspA family protein